MAAQTKNRFRRIQTFLSLLLCALSWRGPVPVLHHHDEFSADTTAMRTHEAAFHPGASGKNPREWHWHFVVPGALPAGEPLSDRTSCPSDIMCLACALAVSSEAGCGRMSCDLSGHSINLPTVADGWLIAVPCRAGTGSGDLQRFKPCQTSPRLTGVLLI